MLIFDKYYWLLSTGNSNTISSSCFFLSRDHGFVLSWPGTLPFWRGMPKVPDFSCISLLELDTDFNIIANHALAISCRVAGSIFHQYSKFIFLKIFFWSVNRKGNRVELYTHLKFHFFVSTRIAIATDYKEEEKKM